MKKGIKELSLDSRQPLPLPSPSITLAEIFNLLLLLKEIYLNTETANQSYIIFLFTKIEVLNKTELAQNVN